MRDGSQQQLNSVHVISGTCHIELFMYEFLSLIFSSVVILTHNQFILTLSLVKKIGKTEQNQKN